MAFCSAQSLLQCYARGGALLEPCLLAYEFLFAIFGKGYLACLAKSIANSSSHDLLPIFNGLIIQVFAKCRDNGATLAFIGNCSYRIGTNDPQRSPAQRD
jgi:hypothetical protein